MEKPRGHDYMKTTWNVEKPRGDECRKTTWEHGEVKPGPDALLTTSETADGHLIDTWLLQR